MSNAIDQAAPQQIDAGRARGAESLRIVRYVLAASLALVIILFAVIFAV